MEYDVIIIGGGIAGLTAAIYLQRANKKTLVLEAKMYGGQIVTTPDIENYPGFEHISGFDLSMNLVNQAKNLGAELKLEEVIGITEDNKVKTKKGEYQAKALVIASGTENRKFGLENEEKLEGRGISYCATCDGNFYKNRIVTVLGGGNTAVEDAIYLSALAEKVYLLHRREEFRADARTMQEIEEKLNVEIIRNAQVTAFLGDTKIEGVKYIKDNEEKELKSDGIFVAIGQIPLTKIVKEIVECDEFGYIKSEDGIHTSKRNIYVAGDVRQKNLRQLVTAAADGALTANAIINEIK